MLILEEREKPQKTGENPFGTRMRANDKHIPHDAESESQIQAALVGGQVLSPLCHLCFP